MFTDQEIKDVNTLHEIAERNGQAADGLDKDLCQHIQDIQKIVFIRSAGRDWFGLKTKENESTTGQGTVAAVNTSDGPGSLHAE